MRMMDTTMRMLKKSVLISNDQQHHTENIVTQWSPFSSSPNKISHCQTFCDFLNYTNQMSGRILSCDIFVLSRVIYSFFCLCRVTDFLDLCNDALSFAQAI